MALNKLLTMQVSKQQKTQTQLMMVLGEEADVCVGNATEATS